MRPSNLLKKLVARDDALPSYVAVSEDLATKTKTCGLNAGVLRR